MAKFTKMRYLRNLILTVTVSAVMMSTFGGAASEHSAEKHSLRNEDVIDYLIIDDFYEDESFWGSADVFFNKEHGGKLMVARDNDSALMKMFPENQFGETIYPDFIGGIYYSREGDLVVQIVKDADSWEASLYTEIRLAMEAMSDVVIEYVDASYNQLKKIVDEIIVLFLDDVRCEVISNTAAFYHRVSENRVVVELFDFNDDTVKAFRERIYDSSFITFRAGCMELGFPVDTRQNASLECTVVSTSTRATIHPGMPMAQAFQSLETWSQF